jgi:hypothetical protein
MLLGIIGIPAWGVGFIPQSAWAHIEKDEIFVETNSSKQNYLCKTSKSYMGRSTLDIKI